MDEPGHHDGQPEQEVGRGQGRDEDVRRTLKCGGNTVMVKKVGPRLRELAYATKGRKEARSRYLGLTFFKRVNK